MITRALPLALLVACGGTPSTTPVRGVANTTGAPAWTPTLSVAADNVPGWIGYTPTATADETPYLFPVSEDWSLLDVDGPEDVPPARAWFVPSQGRPEAVIPGPRVELSHGCDGNTVRFRRWTVEAASSPGVGWILPMPLPDGWSPQPVPIEPAGTPGTYTIGPLALELAILAPFAGELRLRAGERTLHTESFEKQVMDGAPVRPIDLATVDIGVPVPVAAWQIAPGEPLLIALYLQGYEGFALRTLLVDGDEAVPVEGLASGLYYCAF